MSHRSIAVLACTLGVAGCTEEQKYFQCEACFTGGPLPGTCAASHDAPFDHGGSDEQMERSSVVYDLCRKWDRSLSPPARAALVEAENDRHPEGPLSVGDFQFYVYCSSAIDSGKWPVKITCKPKTERVPVPFMGWK